MQQTPEAEKTLLERLTTYLSALGRGFQFPVGFAQLEIQALHPGVSIPPLWAGGAVGVSVPSAAGHAGSTVPSAPPALGLSTNSAVCQDLCLAQAPAARKELSVLPGLPAKPAKRREI